MALGLGLIFGFRFPENFNYPYYATSISRFWQRWHMTLTGWFQEYLFKPVGGYEKGSARGVINLFLTFLLIGIWHGATWTFVFFGLAHATALIAERLFLNQVLKLLPNALRRIWVYCQLIFI